MDLLKPKTIAEQAQTYLLQNIFCLLRVILANGEAKEDGLPDLDTSHLFPC